METDDKARENYCRRWAKRLGLQIRKSRARESIDNYGGYMVIEIYKNIIMWGERFELDLDEVEKFLEDYEQKNSS